MQRIEKEMTEVMEAVDKISVRNAVTCQSTANQASSDKKNMTDYKCLLFLMLIEPENMVTCCC